MAFHPEGNKQFQAPLIKPRNTDSTSSDSTDVEILRISTEICPAVSFHEKIHGLMYHSDPPKVFFVKQICANPTNNNMLSSVHILQHFSLHICYPKRPISRPKHDLIPKTHAPVFFGTCPKTKLLRRPG